MSNKKIIAICGNARSGKDTLGENLVLLLAEMGIKAKTCSFAEQLRIEVDDLLKKTIGISSFTKDNKEKKIIRPFLVFWGTELRRKIDKQIWVRKLNDSLVEDIVHIITDLRFENEFDWVKENNGDVVFLSRVAENGSIVPPANKYELKNNSKLSSLADINFSWLTTDDKAMLESLSYEVLNNILTDEKLLLWKAI